MTDHDMSIEAFERRKAAALAHGWEVCQLGAAVWVGCYDYSWIGDTEFQTWWELLMDAELYDELTEVLGL
jgi:hypothetical protein